MKTIPLTRGRVALVDDADYPALARYKWCVSNNRYAVRRTGPRMFYMHVEVMPHPLGMRTDHVSGNTFDNRRFNLRVCTNAENSRNSIQHGGSSVYKGVSYDKGKRKWHAYIKVDYQRGHIGYFDSELHAAMAYDMWAAMMFGEFAKFNCIPA